MTGTARPSTDNQQVEQAARQFSTRRQSQRTERRRAKNIESHALFYVAGETPLHLRLEAYDLFDGVHWHAETLTEESRFDLALEMIDQRPWQLLPSRVQTLPVFRGARTHAVKLVHFDTDRIPAPIHLRAVHIDMLDRGPMFHGRYGGFFHIDRESIPSLVPIHLVWDVLDVRRVAAHVLSIPPTRPEFTAVPETAGMKRVESLARQWTERIPRGWRQINEVVQRLRTHCEHDRRARPGEEDEFPLEYFLFAARRGPDYQFATAAALMLRSLGYSSRVVSGFYASPERYDPRLRHTPVMSEDVHFWTEVYLGSGIWAPLEPTPGFELLGPPPTWFDQLRDQVEAAVQFLSRNRWTTFLLSIMGLVIAWHRCSILDWLQVRCWSRWSSDHPRRRILAMLRILERRGHWAGLPRPRSATWREWLTSAGEGVVQPASLNLFLTAVDWAAFAPAGAPSPMADHRNTCLEVLRQFSLSRIREARRMHRSAARPDAARLEWPVRHPTGSTSSRRIPAACSNRAAVMKASRPASSSPCPAGCLPPNRES